MFKDDLFSILAESQTEGQADFTIRLNANHPIYTGHFPEDPITPGVCIVQMAIDLFSHITQHNCHLVKAKNVKFLQIIRPGEHPEVHYHLSWEPGEASDYVVKVVVTSEETTFSKMSLQISAA